MSHTCSSALVRCMDFRLESAVRDYLQELNLINDVDMISIAGAAKDIAQQDGSFAESMVDLSNKLHQTKKVILMNHTDCGAYGGHKAFESLEIEHAQYVKDLMSAKEKILAGHPDLIVDLRLAVIEDDGSVHIETI